MCIYVYMQIYRNADSPANSKESELEKNPQIIIHNSEMAETKENHLGRKDRLCSK